jgi:hypothetical protein
MASSKRSVEKEEFWRLVLAEHAASDLSVRAFRKREAISEASFYFWKRELVSRDSKSKSQLKSTQFVPMRVVDSKATHVVADSPPSDNAVIEVGIPGGFTLRAGAANPAIGRNNYLFVGGERGGHDAAGFYSLVSSAKVNGVEPFAWLSDVFTKLPYHRDGEASEQVAAGQPVTSTELDGLLTDRWLESHPRHAWTIDTIRRKEREAKEKSRHQKRRR